MDTTLTTKQQHQLEQVKLALASGLSFSDYAKQNNLCVKSLYNWKSYLVKKGALPNDKKSTFVKANAVEKPCNIRQSNGSITVRFPNGIVLHLDTLTHDTLTLLNSL